jgi:hypothetical protein
MRIETLTLLRQLLYEATLNVGAPDFPEVATLVLAARADLEAAIMEATSEPWPGIELPPGYRDPDITPSEIDPSRNGNPSIDKVGT